MLAHAWKECRTALKVIAYSERRPGRGIKQDSGDKGPLVGGNAVLYRSARESLIDWVTFKWRNEVRGVGPVVVWGKSFLVQEDSQGKGPDMFAKQQEGPDD